MDYRKDLQRRGTHSPFALTRFLLITSWQRQITVRTTLIEIPINAHCPYLFPDPLFRARVLRGTVSPSNTLQQDLALSDSVTGRANTAMLDAFTTVLGSGTCKHCWTSADIVIAGPSSVVMTFVSRHPLHARIEICVTELGHNRQLSPEQCTRSCGLDKASVQQDFQQRRL